MKIIQLNNLTFDNTSEIVKTEETVNKWMLDNAPSVDFAGSYVSAPLVDAINLHGLGYTQSLIDELNRRAKEKMVFVCQHIQVNNINFYDNLVFTPHATSGDDYYAMPHYSVNKVESPTPFKERKYLMSFLGSFMTHPTRSSLRQILFSRMDCLVEDTGNWHFYKEEKEKKSFSGVYNQIMSESKIALCPRGTGPSTIRLWESMAAGCVPLLVSDKLKMPIYGAAEWEDLIIRVPENDLENIMDYIPNIDKLEEMSRKVLKSYNNFFCNSNLHKSITKVLESV